MDMNTVAVSRRYLTLLEAQASVLERIFQIRRQVDLGKVLSKAVGKELGTLASQADALERQLRLLQEDGLGGSSKGGSNG